MHIVHVITRLLHAGSEENTIATCLAAVARGHRVTLVHGREFAQDHYKHLGGKIELRCLHEMVHPIAPLDDLRAVRVLTRLLREIGADLVHTHQSKAGIIGRLAAHRAGVKHVVHGVHIAPFVNVSPLKRVIYVVAERVCARYTDAFICVSDGMRQAYAKAGIGAPERFHVVHSGMPLANFIDATPPEDWRTLAGLGPDEPRPPILLMLAAFEPRKRHVELIGAFKEVVKTFPEARLLFGGDGPIRATVEQAIAEAGLEKNIRILGFYPEPGRLVALADLCLLTSAREGLPRVVVQYIAGGRPALVTHVPGVEEIVQHGVNGILTGPDDFDSLAKAMVALLSDTDRRAALSRGASATDVSSWQETALGDGTLAVYQAISQ